MHQVTFPEHVDDSLLKFAVIVSQYRGKWVFCKHRDRTTWECPGGHREPGESIQEAARRELYEETGALSYRLFDAGAYSCSTASDPVAYTDYGMLYYAEILTFGPLPHLEIKQIKFFDKLPENWTYPDIQPHLFNRIKQTPFQDIAVLFPGIGYTCERPLMQKCISQFHAQGFQIITLDFSAIPFHGPDDLDTAYQTACAQVSKELSGFDFGQYRRILFLSKSLGTACASWYEQQMSTLPSQFFLTPLPQTLRNITGQSQILGMVVGTEDTYVSPTAVTDFCHNHEIPALLIEGVGHSLTDKKDMKRTESIDRKILDRITAFIDPEGNRIELTAPIPKNDVTGIDNISIHETDINSADAKELLGELNAKLTVIPGDDGTVHFKNKDVTTSRSVFLVAYMNDMPYGCGALRELSDDTAEVKRVYARSNSIGIGSRILKALEENAQKMGYQKLLLETRVQNTTAISFYNRNGYQHCENYGVYVGETHSYCFRKTLSYN